MKSIIYFVLPFLFVIFSCESAKDYHTTASKYIDEKNYEQALISINRAIQIEPDSVDHYTLRMMVFDLTGRYEDEILDLNKIIELNSKQNSKSITAHRQRAWAQTQLGLYNEALLDINYVIDNRGDLGSLAEAYLIKAGIFWKLNDTENSKKFYELTINENNGKEKLIESDALVGLANLTKSSIAAIKLLDEAIAINDKSWLAYGARMERFMSLGKTNEAYDDSKMALFLNPDDATLNFNMGQLFGNIGNTDSAVIYLEKAIKLAPQSPNNSLIYMNLGVINHHADNFDKALDYFQKAEAINSEDSILLYNFALLLSDLNRNTEALEKIVGALSINQNNVEYINCKGSILIGLSSFEEAEKELKRAIEINPRYGPAFYNLGYLFGQNNKHEQSIKYYDKAVELNYDLKATLVNRGLQKMKINNKLSACSDLKRAYKLGRTDIKSLIEKNCN